MKSVQRVANTLSGTTRGWLQLVHRTVSVGLGKPTIDNKKVIPESWVVGHLPIYFSIGRDSLCLTDLTEEELELFKQMVEHAYEAALPVCKLLDEAAFEALNKGLDLEFVPNRALRGTPPSFTRPIRTSFEIEEVPEEDRQMVSEYLDRMRSV